MAGGVGDCGTHLAGRLCQPDAELVGDTDHGNGVADLAFGAQFGDSRNKALRRIGRFAEEPEAVRPGLALFGRRCGHRKMRVTGTTQQRRDGQVQSGAPGGKDEIDLVLLDQPRDRLQGIVDVAVIVVFDHFDRYVLAGALQHDTTGRIDLFDPQAIVRKYRDACAGRIGSGQRNCVADPDRLRSLGTRRYIARHHSRDCNGSPDHRQPKHCYPLAWRPRPGRCRARLHHPS